MRITSRFYISLALLYFLSAIALWVVFFSEKQSMPFVLLFIFLNLLFCVFLWFSLNFIDVYYSEEEGFCCRFYSRVLNITKITRLGKIPMTIGSTSNWFIVGYIIFYDERDKKRIKFVVVKSKNWDLVKKMKDALHVKS